MTGRRGVLVKLIAAMAIAGSMVVASPASAYVVCNRWGHCWHTWRPYYYPYPPPYYGPYYGAYYPYYYPYYGPYYGGPALSFGFTFGGGGHSHGHHH
ncbi:MAG TPA: hypothetical protein VMU08_13745 [Rhizomicrobium sp.]|nr:hypothetical protein [Rhizomicrobium sp.]